MPTLTLETPASGNSAASGVRARGISQCSIRQRGISQRRITQRSIAVTIALGLTLGAGAGLPSAVASEQDPTPGVPGPASATSQCSQSTLFSDLGLSTPVPAAYSTSGTPSGTPYGVAQQTFNVSSEVFVGHDEPGIASWDNTAARSFQLIGHNAAPGNFVGTPALSPTVGNKFDAYATAPGDFSSTTSTKKAIVAIGADTSTNPVSGPTDNPNAGLSLFFIDPQTRAQSTPVKLYTGTIGTPHDQNAGYLRYTAGSDTYNAQMLHNYMQIATPDLDGDGIDEIAVWIPDQTDPRIQFFQYKGHEGQWNTNNFSPTGWQNIGSHSIKNKNIAINRVSMVAGDFNFDGSDDLGIAVSSHHVNNDGTLASQTSHSEVQVVLSKGGADGHNFIALYEGDLDGIPSLAVGDPLNTGRDSLLMARVNIQPSSQSAEAHANGYTLDTKVTFNQFVNNPVSRTLNLKPLAVAANQEVITGNTVYPQVRAAFAAASLGAGQGDVLYYQGIVWSAINGAMTRTDAPPAYSASSNTAWSSASLIPTGDKDWDSSMATDGWLEWDAIATDLNNDSKDEIIVNYAPVESSIFSSSPTTQLRTVTNSGPNRGLLWEIVGSPTTGYHVGKLQQYQSEVSQPNQPIGNLQNLRSQRSTIMMAAPDTDTDTQILTYKSQRLVHTDPKVLAVIAGSPMYDDFEGSTSGNEYFSRGGTSLGTSTSQGSGTVKAGTFQSGLYFGFEHEFTAFGIPIASINMEAEYKHQVTQQTESISTVTHSIDYQTTGYRDAVVLYSMPMAIYTYDLTYPTGQSATETQEVTINIPFDPSVKIMDADTYDSIVSQCHAVVNTTGLPLYPLRTTKNGAPAGIVQHTQGKPLTYPANEGAAIAAFGNGVLFSKGSYSSLGYDTTNAIARTIDLSTETTSSTTHQDEFSFTIGGGVGGVKAGVMVGGAVGYGKVTKELSSMTMTGQVPNLPPEAQGKGYGFSWTLMHYTWTSPDGKTAIPVVSYVVKPETAPPLAQPTNVAIVASKTTSSSHTLTWDYPAVAGSAPTGFAVYRWRDGDPRGTTPVATLGATARSYTVTGLRADTVYHYQVMALRTGGSSSLASATVTARTADAPAPSPAPKPPAPTPNPAPQMKMLTWTTPKVTGAVSAKVAVGKVLTAKPGTWTSGATRTVQWLRNGSAISGAKGTTYTTTKADLGKKISVRVSGTKAGYLPVTATSSTITVRGTLTGRVTVSGTAQGMPKVGTKLTAKPAVTSNPTGKVNYSYQWLRNGKAITGSKGKGKTYTVSSADRGKKLSVRITAKKQHHTTLVKTSSKTKAVR
ncbi:MAG: fibronectin type III domain-containing protein [Cellulomonadaceae bacterium]|jgi:hypothetical protein|nr:fibronectin type III domain-containing protein [Cellulomonadaceae bacterium]